MYGVHVGLDLRATSFPCTRMSLFGLVVLSFPRFCLQASSLLVRSTWTGRLARNVLSLHAYNGTILQRLTFAVPVVWIHVVRILARDRHPFGRS
jgi:hypothetical protein